MGSRDEVDEPIQTERREMAMRFLPHFCANMGGPRLAAEDGNELERGEAKDLCVGQSSLRASHGPLSVRLLLPVLPTSCSA
jgi:hypothetical protein